MAKKIVLGFGNNPNGKITESKTIMKNNNALL